MPILLFLAAAPAVALMIYIYKKDSVEKEPVGLLAKLVFFGALSVIFAVIAELILGYIVNQIFVPGTMLHAFIDNFFAVALIEELGKFYALKWGSWKNKAFNYRFDGVVYSVCASLGFALVENIMYVADGGFGTGFSRALTAVPAHAIFGVFMGLFYGRAKHFANFGDPANSKKNLRLALWVPALIHGTYDFCLSANNDFLLLFFFVLLVGMYIVAFRAVKKAAQTDIPIVSFWYNANTNNDGWGESESANNGGAGEE